MGEKPRFYLFVAHNRAPPFATIVGSAGKSRLNANLCSIDNVLRVGETSFGMLIEKASGRCTWAYSGSISLMMKSDDVG
jgi:hypothetical protein